ncbi:MAG: hypothetical protein IPK97_17300 [Ahniella sp.]|nr:hypothetical protein [Ahniella sp.]
MLEARGLAVRADGKPIVAGFRYSTNVEKTRSSCARFNVAGNLVSTFDSDGCAEPTLALIENGGEIRQSGGRQCRRIAFSWQVMWQ